jgi:mannobiose 2-epimerase
MVFSAPRPLKLAETFRYCLEENLLRKWYPLVIDEECGGYLTNVTHDWQLASDQEKMIVTQARHVWTTSKAASFMGDDHRYEKFARHGFLFLKDFMWDKRYGGFFQIRSREGGYSECRGWGDEKRTYGNAFGIYALASLYGLTSDPEVLDLAKEAFDWLESHAHDHEYKGYFQFLTRQGEPFDEESQYRSVASDACEVGLKDQNSSIHLLEAYAELYRVWKDETLRDRLAALLELVRDTIVTETGYLRLFFTRDWSPVSFRTASEATRTLNYGLDHVSFGHDYEAAFLLLEASQTLEINNDVRTLSVAKQMLDHAIDNGWDREAGGFFEGGYYFDGSDQCAIVKNTKTWWAQAEALNSLLIFSRIFPQNVRYRQLFEKQWEYIDRYLLDHKNGDWYEGGLDKEPFYANGPKSHMWKCTYHTARALMNCTAILSDESNASPGIGRWKCTMDNLINHWKGLTLAP